MCQRSKINPCGNVLQTYIDQRVIVHVLAKEAAERSLHAFVAVVLGLRPAIVDEQEHAAMHGIGQGLHPCWQLNIDFAAITIG